MGPGRFKANTAITSSRFVGFNFVKVSTIPALSTWKTPHVSPLPKSSKDFKSLKGISVKSIFILCFSFINFNVSSIIVRFAKPRKSNFNNPAFSQSFILNCVAII